MRLLIICTALAAPNFVLAETAHAHAQVKVHISLKAPGALELVYDMPATCARLPFHRHDDAYQSLRAAWQSLDACGAIAGGALTRSGKPCPQLRFRVPASTDKGVGYPGAFPIGEAIYAHTSKYAVSAECGSVSYHFSAPGSLGLQGKVHHGSATVAGEEGGDLAVLLMPRALAPSAAVLAYYDPKLSSATKAQITDTLEGTVDFYRKALPDARFTMPIVAAGLATQPGGPNIGGDAADIMRFTFFNWPAEPPPQLQRMTTRLVAHEMSHRFQLRDAVDAHPDARLIHEGGGEFLRWVVSVKKGWLTRAQAASELDEKLAECMLGVGQRSWSELSRREIASNYYEYACGLPAYVYVLAARQGKGSALSRINAFYRDLRPGAAPRFEHALECGDDTHCAPRWLGKLLGKSMPMSAAWDDLLRTSGLATPAAPTQPQQDAMMNRALVQLVKDDCGGGSSTTVTPDGMIIDPMLACKTIRKEAYVTRVESMAVFGNTRALALMMAACTERAKIELGMKNGDTLVMPCKTPFAARSQFYKADIGRVLARLERD